jgi:uncharacterized protein (DUF58 family)
MNSYISRRWQRWVNRRIPRSDTRVFNQKNVFIVPTGAGVMFGILLLIMLLTGINYQNSLIYLTTFLLGAVFVGAMHQTHRNLSGLELVLTSAGEGTAGEEIPFQFMATAGRNDAASVVISCEEISLAPLHIPAGETRSVVLPVPSAHRGYVRPERIRVETRFPFGLLKAWSWIRPLSVAMAFPRALAAPDMRGSVNEGEEAASVQPVDGNDHADLRPWREGDPAQRVMWKRFARSGQMVVADWEGEAGAPYWLDFDAFPGADHELRLGYLAWLARHREHTGSRYGLSLPGQIIQPASGPDHLLRCLRALAVWGEEKPRDNLHEPYGTRHQV